MRKRTAWTRRSLNCLTKEIEYMAKFLDGNGLGHLWDIIKEHVSTAVATAKATIDAYTINGKKISSNPTLSKGDLGLGNVTNDAQVKRTEMGKANGVATLDSGGKVPSAQLPSYVDDVLEYAAKSNFPATGEAGKIYVSTNDNKTWRWSGTTYVEISQGVTLGETSSTAYAGDKGAKLWKVLASFDTIVYSLGNPNPTEDGVKLPYGVVYVHQLSSVEINTGQQTITLPAATTTLAGIMTAADKAKLNGIAAGATADSALSTSEIDSVCV